MCHQHVHQIVEKKHFGVVYNVRYSPHNITLVNWSVKCLRC